MTGGVFALPGQRQVLMSVVIQLLSVCLTAGYSMSSFSDESAPEFKVSTSHSRWMRNQLLTPHSYLKTFS